MEQGLSQSLFPAFGSPFPLPGQPGWALVGEDVFSLLGLDVQASVVPTMDIGKAASVREVMGGGIFKHSTCRRGGRRV